MIIPLAQVNMSTHQSYITRSSDHIHVFKQAEYGCAYHVFNSDESIQAGDYILEPVPETQYRVSIEGEDEFWIPSVVTRGI